MELKTIKMISVIMFSVVAGLFIAVGVTENVTLGVLAMVAYLVFSIFVFKFWRCPTCGKMIRIFSKYCPHCGDMLI